jgi:4-oxalocrotonate tautomerase
MPNIRVEMLEGRSPEQKSAMARELTEAFLRTAGGRREAISVVITEVSAENWAIGGGILADKS